MEIKSDELHAALVDVLIKGVSGEARDKMLGDAMRSYLVQELREPLDVLFRAAREVVPEEVVGGLRLGPARGHGVRFSHALLIQHLIRELDPECKDGPSMKLARLVAEREQIMAQLRTLCAKYGDNDWPDNAYLPDVIEKHLACHLQAASRSDKT